MMKDVTFGAWESSSIRCWQGKCTYIRYGNVRQVIQSASCFSGEEKRHLLFTTMRSCKKLGREVNSYVNFYAPIS